MIKAEQRQFKRYETQQLLDYLILDEQGNSGAYSMGRTLDMSCNGLRLETSQPIKPDTRLRITVEVEMGQYPSEAFPNTNKITLY